mmetsp:Transcript_28737/g.32851  ORF Transcript_28737/g.32851 Transcript_28737/m.32851 type:complete len:245 (+) Transcript_28737:40-774(+)
MTSTFFAEQSEAYLRVIIKLAQVNTALVMLEDSAELRLVSKGFKLSQTELVKDVVGLIDLIEIMLSFLRSRAEYILACNQVLHIFGQYHTSKDQNQVVVGRHFQSLADVLFHAGLVKCRISASFELLITRAFVELVQKKKPEFSEYGLEYDILSPPQSIQFRSSPKSPSNNPRSPLWPYRILHSSVYYNSRLKLPNPAAPTYASLLLPAISVSHAESQIALPFPVLISPLVPACKSPILSSAAC